MVNDHHVVLGRIRGRAFDGDPSALVEDVMRRGPMLFAASAAQAQGVTAVDLVMNAELGSILADAEGNTLYLFTNDEREKSNCSEGCAAAWPPLLTDAEPVAGEGVDTGRLGTITRDDGGTQVTFNGWPLSHFVNDGAPGDTNGQTRDD